MENEKKNATAQELSDESLDAIVGGGGFIEAKNTLRDMGADDEKITVAVQWDSRGRAIQWKEGNETYHYECPHCGRKMHFGTADALYCDPCNDYFYWSQDKYKVKD